jgi:hypothetical protein
MDLILLATVLRSTWLFEDKVAFYKLCQQKGIKIPEGEIASLPALDFDRLSRKYGTPWFIQFGRGWAGNSYPIL